MTSFLSLHDAVAEYVHDGIMQRTGWPVRFADTLEQTSPPTESELRVLRDLYAQTKLTHTGKATPHAGAD